jgi:hypothetical protein
MGFNVEGQKDNNYANWSSFGWKLMKMVHKQPFLWQTWKWREGSQTFKNLHLHIELMGLQCWGLEQGAHWSKKGMERNQREGEDS